MDSSLRESISAPGWTPEPAALAPCAGAAGAYGRMAPATYGRAQYDAMVARHAPLVRRLALRLSARLPANVELDDLIQAGMIGLLDAVKRYREIPTAQFETYATQRIRGAMLDELRNLDWIPRTVRERARKVEAAIHALEQRLGQPPSEAQVAQELGISLAQYHALLQEAHGAQLLHFDDLGGDAEAYLPRLEPDDPLETPAHGDPLDTLMARGLRTALIAAIERLPEREKLLLSLYYEQGLNLKEIGLVLEVGEARVCQLRAQAIARLRASLRQR